MSLWRELRNRSGTSILDVGCGRHSSLAYLANHYRFDPVGLDIFEPYLKQAKARATHRNFILADARYLPFKGKSFDAAVCVEVIEHAERKDGDKILDELDRVSRWLVVISTPIGRAVQQAYDGNPFQEHKSTWSIEDLKTRNFNIRGRGLRGMSGDSWGRMPLYFLRPLQYIIEIVATLFSYQFPRIAAHAVAWKETSP